MSNGDVYPCLRAIGHYDTQPLGNIYHQTIDVIRSSPAWRKYADNAGKHSVCKTCKNLFEFNIKQEPPNSFNKKANHAINADRKNSAVF